MRPSHRTRYMSFGDRRRAADVSGASHLRDLGAYETSIVVLVLVAHELCQFGRLLGRHAPIRIFLVFLLHGRRKRNQHVCISSKRSASAIISPPLLLRVLLPLPTSSSAPPPDPRPRRHSPATFHFLIVPSNPALTTHSSRLPLPLSVSSLAHLLRLITSAQCPSTSRTNRAAGPSPAERSYTRMCSSAEPVRRRGGVRCGRGRSEWMAVAGWAEGRTRGAGGEVGVGEGWKAQELSDEAR